MAERSMMQLASTIASEAWYMDHSTADVWQKLLDNARDRLYTLDVLRSCHAIPNVFEEDAGNLAHQDVSSTDGVVVA